jgi:intracellular multiplication protein IcmL
MSPPASLAQASTSRKGVSLVKRTDRATARSTRNSRLNNAYLQDGSKTLGLLRLLNVIAVAGLIILVGLLTHFSSSKTRILPTTSDNKLIMPPPVDEPVDENIVSLWLVDAVTQSTTMGFHDYQIRLKEIRPLFTDRGWESFMRYMKTSYGGRPSLVSRLDNDRLVLYSTPVQAPQILQRGLVNGVYTYVVRYTVRLQETSIVSNADPRYTIDISIERVKAEISPSGLAVSQWRIKLDN